MKRQTLDLAGILPPITTPFDHRGALDAAALERNVRRYNRAGLRGYVAFGSNGEAVHLDAAERRRVLEVLRRAADPGHAIVAGINELATAAAIRATREAADAGADAALVITPYFYKGAMTQDVLRRFYLDVAAASPLPVLVYNVPQNTGVAIAPSTVAALAETGNVVGLKDSAGDFAALAETLRLVPAGFQVLVGNAGILHPALQAGAAGAILAVACVVPEACVELARAVRAGEHERARDLQRRIAPLGRMVTAELGIPGLKAALDVAGYAGGAPRPPLRPLDDERRQRVAETLEKSGLATSRV